MMHRHCRMLLLLAVGLSLPAAVAAERSESAAAAAELQDCLATMAGIDSRFEQTVYDEFGEALSSSSGRLESRPPDRLRWELRKPVQELLLIADGQLQHYQPELAQLTRSPLDRSAPWLLLLAGELAGLQSEYHLQLNRHGRDRQFLLRRRPDAPLTEAPPELSLTLRGCAFHTLSWRDRLGQRVEMQLRRSRGTPALRRFRFQPPDGTEIVDIDG